VLARSWRAPYDDGRRMTIYGALQELTTFVIYRKQRMWARRLGDPVLPELYRLIGRDEMAHARFYLRMVALHLADDPDGTRADIAYVLRTFRRTCCLTTRIESRQCARPASTAGSS
jgi:acyl-[acyl-carrier-protein] desaturase